MLMAPPRQLLKMLLPYVGIAIALVEHLALPNVHPVTYTPYCWRWVLAGCAALYTVALVLAVFLNPVRRKLLRFSWLLAFIFVFFSVWDVATIKTGTLKMPFIPSPDRVIDQLIHNYPTILLAARASLLLLGKGLVIGLVLGTLSGILIGCSRLADYWISPLLKIIGPVPGLVWLPVFFVASSSSAFASLAAVVIAVWFPITLMLGNAMKNTDASLIERAQTLGASKPYIVLRVMFPAAIPAFANALFMALAASFGALSSAELCGVKTGLALAVKQMGTIANFGLVFAYVLVMIVIFSTLTAIMFGVRNWLLRWQRDLVRW